MNMTFITPPGAAGRLRILSLELDNPFSRIEICRSLDLHNIIRESELNVFQSERTDCLIRRNELQSERTDCLIRGKELPNRGTNY